MSAIEYQEAEAGVGTKSPLVARVYTDRPCLRQSGGKKIVWDSVVNLGDAGPVVLFWQASARTPVENRGLRLQPLVNNEADEKLANALFANERENHRSLLRRRALTKSLAAGDVFFGATAADGVITDENDVINMVALDISDMSAPPLVRLSEWGPAEAGSVGYTKKNFTSNGGPLLISVSTTAISRDAGLIGSILWLDNQPVAYHKVYANSPNTHYHVVGGDRVINNMQAGTHQLRLIPDDKATVDPNDLWSLTVMEMQSPSSATQLIDSQPAAKQQGGGVVASAPYKARGGEQLICVWMSARGASGNQWLTAQVLVDDNLVGGLRTYANSGGTVYVLSGGDIAPGTIPAGDHTIKIVAGPGTITEEINHVSLTVLEVFR